MCWGRVYQLSWILPVRVSSRHSPQQRPTIIVLLFIIPGLCAGGECTNSVGSFQCVCPAGTVLNRDQGSYEDSYNVLVLLFYEDCRDSVTRFLYLKFIYELVSQQSVGDYSIFAMFQILSIFATFFRYFTNPYDYGANGVARLILILSWNL